MMGQWRGKYLDVGPPRGPGRYSGDGRWWWDDGQGRWFRLIDQDDVLEVKAEDVGGTSLVASLLTTLSSQYGNAYRFVARARSADPRWPTYAQAGGTFPATRPSLENVAAQGAWLEIQRERFQELHRQLVAEGWRPAGHGAAWWSAIYRRPDLDCDTPADAYEPTPRSA
jgi:hypothetical protein